MWKVISYLMQLKDSKKQWSLGKDLEEGIIEQGEYEGGKGIMR